MFSPSKSANVEEEMKRPTMQPPVSGSKTGNVYQTILETSGSGILYAIGCWLAAPEYLGYVKITIDGHETGEHRIMVGPPPSPSFPSIAASDIGETDRGELNVEFSTSLKIEAKTNAELGIVNYNVIYGLDKV